MYLVTCVYKEPMSSKFGGKPYDFTSNEKVAEGTLQVVNDRYGFSLVKVISNKEVEKAEDFYKPIVNLDEINAKILEVKNAIHTK